MRFTQAATCYNIPKGTLYDNILGKANRMEILEKASLDANEEKAVLEYCCDVSISPYNRRTKKSLASILEFVHKLKKDDLTAVTTVDTTNTSNTTTTTSNSSNKNNNNNDGKFQFNGKSGFRWWWAFCKKYSIVSLYYDSNQIQTSSSTTATTVSPAKTKASS